MVSLQHLWLTVSGTCYEKQKWQQTNFFGGNASLHNQLKACTLRIKKKKKRVPWKNICTEICQVADSISFKAVKQKDVIISLFYQL